MQPHERVGILLGDLLDLDAALRREHEERLLRAAVERDREVVLLRDVGGLLDPELADDVAVDVEPEDLARLLLGVGRILGELDAAGLAAAAGQHLRLDDDRRRRATRPRRAPPPARPRAVRRRRECRRGGRAPCPGTRRDPRRRTLTIARRRADHYRMGRSVIGLCGASAASSAATCPCSGARARSRSCRSSSARSAPSPASGSACASPRRSGSTALLATVAPWTRSSPKTSASATRTCRRSTASRSPCARARCSACSARTARASRRPCARSRR